VVDFAPHDLEFLRERHAHRRLGFAPEQMAGWFAEAGLDVVAERHLASAAGGRDALTVSLWLAQDRRVVTDWPLRRVEREVA
jgi:ArsR family transcriptional regulator